MSAPSEEQIFCIQLPDNTSPLSGPGRPLFIAVLRDWGEPWTVLGTRLPFYADYEVIQRTCIDRAVQTVDGSLRVTGDRIKPERYIKRWRDALASPIALAELEQRFGLAAMARFAWRHEPRLLAMNASWTHPSFPTLGDLLTGLGRRAASWSEGQAVEIALDLAADNGTRNAWWLQSFLTPSGDVADASVALELVSTVEPIPKAGSIFTTHQGELA